MTNTNQTNTENTLDDSWQEAIKSIEENDVSVLEALLDNNPSLKNQKGGYKFWQGTHWTLLHIAIINQKEDVVSILLEAGLDANGNRKDYETLEGYWTPLHLASVNFPNIAKKLIAKEAEIDIFVMASLGMDENIKLTLSQNPEYIKSRGPDGAFPLHFAASTGQISTTKLLVEMGSKLDSRDLVRKETAFEWANGNTEVQQVLHNLGAQIDPISDIAVIIFYVSEIGKSVDFYKNLLGFQVNFQNEDWADLSLNGTSFGLQKKPDLIGGGSPLVSLKTAHLHNLVKKLLDIKDKNPELNDVMLGDVQKSQYGDSLLIQDPDGNNINLYQPK